MAGSATQRLWCSRAAKADLFIRGARVIDPVSGRDEVLDVLVAKGKIGAVGAGLEAPEGIHVREADGCLLIPGLVDLHAHLREPGGEEAEEIATGTAAAAAGGYVAVFAMANTDPVIDNAGLLEGLAQRARSEAVVPLGFHAAVTVGQKGERLTEMVELSEYGVAAFSDDGVPLPDANTLRRALQYASVTGRHIAVHAEDRSLTRGGVMHEGAVSARLGLGGMPSIAESMEVERALEVAAYEDARLHLCHISTAASLEHLARAKAAGVPVTAEACPHHLVLGDEAVVTLDPNLKMNPPLRSEADRKALVEAVADGIVDCVATDHAPHCPDDKEVPFEEAPFGVTGLETALTVLYDSLVREGRLGMSTLVERMSTAPAAIAGIPAPSIAEGADADLCLFDPDHTWTLDQKTVRSRSWNSPWWGAELRGRPVLTVAAGRIVWDPGA